MKPSTMLASVVLAGWISSPAIAFPREEDWVAAQPRASDSRFQLAGDHAHAATCEVQGHAASCRCAQCSVARSQND